MFSESKMTEAKSSKLFCEDCRFFREDNLNELRHFCDRAILIDTDIRQFSTVTRKRSPRDHSRYMVHPMYWCVKQRAKKWFFKSRTCGPQAKWFELNIDK